MSRIKPNEQYFMYCSVHIHLATVLNEWLSADSTTYYFKIPSVPIIFTNLTQIGSTSPTWYLSRVDLCGKIPAEIHQIFPNPRQGEKRVC